MPRRFFNRLLVALLAAFAFAALAPAAQAANKERAAAPEKRIYVCPGGAQDAQEFDKPGFCGMEERIEKRKQMRVAVLLFNGAQIIDYAGPMEVFGQAGAKVFTVAPTAEVRTSVFGLQVRPDYDFEHAPPADILLVPGGNANEIALSDAYKAWLRQRVEQSRIVLSVCTGAFVLGEAGLLDGLPAATTFASAISDLGMRYPKLGRVVRDQRYVDTGKIITTAGLSAGIDGALHVVDRWMGRDDAKDVARGLEYDWKPDSKSSFGMLALQKMPTMWHMLVPPDLVAWDRYSEVGDNHKWETRAHVEFKQTADEFLDFTAGQVKDEQWQPQASGKLWRSFRRQIDGRSWELRMTLLPGKVAGEFDFVASLRER